MNQTPNYALNQWEASDRVQRTDFNADNAKIDAAISAAVTRFATGTYQGTGEYGAEHPNSLTFDFEPKVVIVIPAKDICGMLGILFHGTAQTQIIYGAQYGDHRFASWVLSWEGNTVSWFLLGSSNTEMGKRAQANDNTTYQYFAIG